MATIKQNIDRMKLALKSEDDTGKPAGLNRLVKAAAISAVHAGAHSTEWVKYMSIYADNEAQLRRLTGNDGDAGAAYLRESTAYMVTDPVCGSFTRAHFGQQVDSQIDDNLDATRDPNFKKFMEIPEVAQPPAPADQSNPQDEQPNS